MTMSCARVPLSQQLIGLWSSAIALAAGLAWLDQRRADKFVWLVPPPEWRRARPLVVELFRVRPIVAVALVGVPLAALLASVVLCATRIGPAIARGNRGR
jgi:hypothetical protein